MRANGQAAQAQVSEYQLPLLTGEGSKSLVLEKHAEPRIRLEHALHGALELAMQPRASAEPLIVVNRGRSGALLLEVNAEPLKQALAILVAGIPLPSYPARVLARVDAAGAEIRVPHAAAGMRPAALTGRIHNSEQTERESRVLLARQLVESQGGRLEMRAAGRLQPATLLIRLPAQHIGPDLPPQRHCVDCTLSGWSEACQQLDHTRVLLVEDDPDALEFLTLILRQAGADVEPFSLAAPAHDFYTRAAVPPDVVVSDIAMPYEDGYSLLRRIRNWEREHERTPAPAIAVSAFAREEDLQRAVSCGFDRHLAKPLDATRLIKEIASWTESNPDGLLQSN